MRGVINGSAVVAAALCVVGFLVGGGAAVLGVVLVAVAAVAWQVAAASRPRPSRAVRVVRVVRVRPPDGRRPSGRIGHQRDPHVVRDERGQGQRVEDLVEPEPPR
ncbi:hypothetical protein GCM10010346_29500 [Streptomyces chryseus]|uniref:Secreted protein n=1 Tax=Streptomyces chryseus TaxID=68186 RepID=A0ABQ3DLN0_9ACTN|nr:hypothetical protein GCM10010346_29500 [Streptomyces chryseus]